MIQRAQLSLSTENSIVSLNQKLVSHVSEGLEGFGSPVT
jgi:hypothetical protein